jgi:hypothetical protein
MTTMLFGFVSAQCSAEADKPARVPFALSLRSRDAERAFSRYCELAGGG